MSSFNPLQPVHSAVLERLAAEPGMTVQAVHKALKKAEVPVSLPNLYRIIGSMIDVQMIVREKGKLALSRAWIPHLFAFAQTVDATYLQSDADVLQLPLKEGERREYKADSLAGLDPIWFHLLLRCAEQGHDKEWYAYNAHPWHVLGMADTELRGYESLAKHGIACRMLYGNDTFLDTYGAKLVRIKHFHVRMRPDVPFLREGYALWVCDDYVIECVFPDVLTRHFAHFFRTVEQIEDFDAELFSNVFRMKAPCKVTLRCAAKDAKRLRETLRKQW